MRRVICASVLILLSTAALAQPAEQPAVKAPATNAPGRSTEQFATTRDVVYASPGGHDQKLDVYMPRTVKDGDKCPLVVWVHGGGWEAGNKDFCPAASLVRDGFVVASIDYRLTDVGAHPAQIHDCKAAIRWLRAHATEYHIDVERVGVWGASAGGHLVALLGTSGGVKELEGDEGNLEQSSRVQAVCDWYGPTDFLKFVQDAEAEKLPNPRASESAQSMIGKLLGGALKDKADTAKSASPVTFVSKDDPPFLIMHGDKDQLVPVVQSRELLEALKGVGVEARLEVAKGAGHGDLKAEGFEPGKMVREFFVSHLKGGEKPQQPQSPHPAGK